MTNGEILKPAASVGTPIVKAADTGPFFALGATKLPPFMNTH